MKDILSDIVSHTQNLGFLNIAKITGTNEKLQIDSMEENRKVILYAETKDPYPDMLGVFGMPQMQKLKYLLECPEYRENAKISIKRDENSVPIGLHFENQLGDYQNDYRFMSTAVINEKLKPLKFKGAKWDVELEPSLLSIQRFQYQAQSNSEYTTFVAKISNNNLSFIFGDEASHAGEFVFGSGVSGKLSKNWVWPIDVVLSVLKISDVNNTKLSISNDGAMQITLDSGLTVYQYIFPGNL